MQSVLYKKYQHPYFFYTLQVILFIQFSMTKINVISFLIPKLRLFFFSCVQQQSIPTLFFEKECLSFLKKNALKKENLNNF